MEVDYSSAILENSPVGFCIISSDLELLYVTAPLLQNLDLTEPVVLGTNWINTLIEKNNLGFKSAIFRRWLRIKLNSGKSENQYVLKIFEDSKVDFYIQIKSIPDRRNLVTVYPVSGTILLHQSRMTQTLDKEYKIAGKIQRNINDYIMDMIEGRFFKYHFKRLFMPSGILSGDIVNIKPVSRRYSSVFLGDGRGHGLPAALYSALIHSYLNIMASGVNHGETHTGTLVSQINKYAYRDFYETGEFYFFSGVYALLDGNTKNFCVTNAGHPYPVFIRDGKISRLESHGPLVGVNQNAEFAESVFELKNGDVVIFFTDGVYDVLQGEVDRDHDGVTSILNKYMAQQNATAAGVFSYLVETINSYKSRLDISDDITIVQMLVEEKI